MTTELRCDQCGKPLPAGSTARRRFCSARCRGRYNRSGSESYADRNPRAVSAPTTDRSADLNAVLPSGAPVPVEHWSPLVKATYAAIATSPHTAGWKASDWATLMLYAELLDEFLASPRRSPMMLGELNRMATRLGATQVDRLSAGTEVDDLDENVFEGWADVND